MDVEIGFRALLFVGRKKLWQQIGGWNGGSSQMDDVPAFVDPAFNQMIFQAQDTYGTFIKLLPAWCQLNVFCGAYQQAGLKLLLQLTDVGTDGGLEMKASPMPW